MKLDMYQCDKCSKTYAKGGGRHFKYEAHIWMDYVNCEDDLCDECINKIIIESLIKEHELEK